MGDSSKLFKYLFTGQFGKLVRGFGDRFRRYIFHRAKAYIYELNIADNPSDNYEPTFPEGYRCRLMEKGDIPACAALSGHTAENFSRRIEAGDFCFGVFQDIRPANINWIHIGSTYVRGYGYIHTAGENDYYIYGIVTGMDERGKGLYKNCLKELTRYLQKRGAEKLIQLVEDFNAPVLHTLPKLGYSKTKIIQHTYLLGIKYCSTFDITTGRKSGNIFFRTPRRPYTI
jgi:ribosomal protein S18 acetylase RimI-like enzyme